MLKIRLTKKIIFLFAVLVLAAVTLAVVGAVRDKIRLADNIAAVTANPDRLTPEQLLERIDSSFLSLPREERRQILNDPVRLEMQIEIAAYRNYQEAFSALFSVPAAARKPLVERAAEAVRAACRDNPRGVAGFYESPVGRAALRAASRYYLLELSGREKMELRPLTDAFEEFHRQQKEGSR